MRGSEPTRGRSGATDPPRRPAAPRVKGDVRRIGRFIAVGCVAALAALVVVLSLAAANTNSKNTLLQRDGVPVTVTVTRCVGNVSGSGSRVAGYTCRGSFDLHGHHYQDVVGGLTQSRSAGSTVRGITDPSDPSILGWFPAVQHAPSSVSSFVAPGILLGVLVLLVPLVVWRIRRAPTRSR